MSTNPAGESRSAILREILETVYFDLRKGRPVSEVIKLVGDTLNDDAAIRGRFEGTEAEGVTERSKARLLGACRCDDDDGTSCIASDPESGYLCTLKARHDGNHLACTDVAHGIAEWS